MSCIMISINQYNYIYNFLLENNYNDKSIKKELEQNLQILYNLNYESVKNRYKKNFTIDKLKLFTSTEKTKIHQFYKFLQCVFYQIEENDFLLTINEKIVLSYFNEILDYFRDKILNSSLEYKNSKWSID